MADLVPPDEIYVPWQAAIDYDIYARDGVITKEHKYLLATPKMVAADEMYEALDMLIKAVTFTVNQYECDGYIDIDAYERLDEAIGKTKAAFTLADGDKDGG